MTAAHGTPESHDEHATAPAHGDPQEAHHDAGHGDDHHDGGSLGPIDWPMWLAGVLGVAVAVVIIAATVLATDFAFFGVPAAH
jgi:hypothetical protein